MESIEWRYVMFGFLAVFALISSVGYGLEIGGAEAISKSKAWRRMRKIRKGGNIVSKKILNWHSGGIEELCENIRCECENKNFELVKTIVDPKSGSSCHIYAICNNCKKIIFCVFESSIAYDDSITWQFKVERKDGKEVDAYQILE